jgi:hypothetical protein
MARKRPSGKNHDSDPTPPSKKSAMSPNLTRDPSQTRWQSIQLLIDWVRSLEGGYIHPSIKVQSRHTDGWPVDFTLVIDGEAISAAETAITVPVEATMSYLTFPFNRPSHYETSPLDKVLRDPSDLDSTVLMALFLMREYLHLGLSMWMRYIESLPKPSHAASEMGMVAWYEGEDLDWLRGTSLYGAREAQLNKWKGEWRDICSRIDKEEWVEDDEMWCVTSFLLQ